MARPALLSALLSISGLALAPACAPRSSPLDALASEPPTPATSAGAEPDHEPRSAPAVERPLPSDPFAFVAAADGIVAEIAMSVRATMAMTLAPKPKPSARAKQRR